ncbi:MAG: diguanylate cyclase [Firmicutes bacterium]|nr:diguanylate cyclase [Bacillota bacterium]
MKLGNKLIISMLLYFVIGITSLNYVTDIVVMKSYSKLEKDNLYLEGERVRNIFTDATKRLDDLTKDWAYWDDTYEFLYNENKEFVDRNLVVSTFEEINMDYAIIYNNNGQAILDYRYDENDKKIKKVKKSVINELWKYKNKDGLINIDGKVLSISSRQITDTNKIEKPEGLLVFAYDFDKEIIKNLKDKLKADIEVDFNESSFNSDIDIKTYNANSTASFKIPYLNDNKAMEVKINIPNKITNLGKKTITEFIWLNTAMFLIFTFILFLILRFVIINRLYKLRKGTHEITKSKDLSKRLNIKGNDEVSDLKDDINFMLEKIESINQELTEYATFDMLTGVLNRRAGLKILKKHMFISKEKGTPLTIAYIDVNNLKVVNDKGSHQLGDRLLTDVVDIINSNIRNTDKVCRLGGDEFLIIFPNSDYITVNKIFNRIQSVLQKINKSSNKPYSIAISKGIVEYDKEMDIDHFIELADKYMYEEKKNK